jgi:CheY-like chemotaxis protein
MSETTDQPNDTPTPPAPQPEHAAPPPAPQPEKSDDARKGFAVGFKAFSEGLWSLGKVLLAAFIAVEMYSNREAVSSFGTEWLASATHLEFLTFSVERKNADTIVDSFIKQKKAQDQEAGKKGPKEETHHIDSSLTKGAVVRALNNAQAIVGSKILWVDPHPENNVLEIEILSSLGIAVFTAIDTTIALKILPVFQPDLIISDVGRQEPPVKPDKCRVYYFEAPPNLDLIQINKEAVTGSVHTGGYSMAETIASTPTPWMENGYANHVEPRILFFSASNGERAANQCARIITNRVDALLQNVVSALETFRWQKLHTTVEEEEKAKAKTKAK